MMVSLGLCVWAWVSPVSTKYIYTLSDLCEPDWSASRTIQHSPPSEYIKRELCVLPIF